MMHRRRRILLLAEAANPEWVSVPLIGWSLSQALARVTDAHLVTHVRNREAIQRAGLVEGRDFTTIDNERVAAAAWRLAQCLRGGAGKGWTTVTALSSLVYYSFEHEVWRLFADRIAAHEFDLVHRITPVSPTHQSPIAKRLWKYGVPFVIGPLNGGVPWPRNFADRQHAEREWLSHIRALYKLLPGYRSTRRYSSAIITGSRHTYEEMPDWARQKCVMIPENGVDPERFSKPRSKSASLPLRGAFVGRLVPYKGADLLMQASAPFLKEGVLTLDIVGDGPQRPELEALVISLKIGSAVRFHGDVPHTHVQAILRECDFLALPSVREFGGGVVVEAMALGVTPIVADYAGPAELVDDQTGIRVRFTNKQTLVEAFTATIRKLSLQPEILDEMGAAGRAKVARCMTWDAKAAAVMQIYDRVSAPSVENATAGPAVL